MRLQSAFMYSFALSGCLISFASEARERPRGIGELAMGMGSYTASCIVRTQPKNVSIWLGTIRGSAEEKSALRNLNSVFPTCFGVYMSGDWAPSYDYISIRIKLISHILSHQLSPLPEPRQLDRTQWFESATLSKVPPDVIVANDLGFCLARSDWPATRSLVESAPLSSVENSSMKKLIPMISGCLPAGAKLTIDRPRLRGIMEETAYHAVGGASEALLAKTDAA